MTPHRVVVADDERPARAKLTRAIAADARFRVVGEAANGREAVAQIAELAPALVFLDIRMPGLDGFAVLEAAATEPAVIFSTAHGEHALRAFDARAVDYLLKPYAIARVQRALDRAHAELVAAKAGPEALEAWLSEHGAPVQAQWLLCKTSAGLTRIELQSVLRICAAGKHVHVLTAGATHVVRESLNALALRLCPAQFVRTHRSEIVNLQHVVRLEPFTHGDGILTLSDGSSAVLTRTFRASFLAQFR